MTEPQEFAVDLSPAAIHDVAMIVAYITMTRDADAAESFVDLLMERVAALRQFPFRGARPKEMDEIDAPVRQFIFGIYRVVYAVIGRQVSILLVADGRRDLQALLRDRLLGRDPPA